jgi:hypothetical protein
VKSSRGKNISDENKAKYHQDYDGRAESRDGQDGKNFMNEDADIGNANKAQGFVVLGWRRRCAEEMQDA